MKRRRLETTASNLKELTQTILDLKNKYKDKSTQIEVLELNELLNDFYTVTIWEIK